MKRKLLFLTIFLSICVSGCASRAKELGTEIGTGIGKKVGTVQGYTEAISIDIPKGEVDGKEDGLSAEDTVVVIKGKMQDVGKLDVLVAGVSLNNFHRLGNNYAALYLMKADAVFSIDLSKVQVDQNREGSQIYVTVPQPEIEVYYDEAETEKVAEWQKNYFSGDANDGFTAYLNSMKEIEENASEELAQNDNLMNMARTSAEKQISRLISNICGAEKKININFEN